MQQTGNNMETLSVRDYRNNLAATFDKVDKGQRVLIRRKNKIYALISVGQEDLSLSPELQKRLDDAHRAYQNGESTVLNSEEDINNYFDSL